MYACDKRKTVPKESDHKEPSSIPDKSTRSSRTWVVAGLLLPVLIIVSLGLVVDRPYNPKDVRPRTVATWEVLNQTRGLPGLMAEPEDPIQNYLFEPNAFDQPQDWEITPGFSGYLANDSTEIEAFLKQSLIDNSTGSNFLSQKLRTSVEVIKEAQRIHFNLFEDVIGKFKYCILLDIADHENKGDQAINVGEIYYLARAKVELIYYCGTWKCSEAQLKKALQLARTHSPEDLVIILHGGGNLNRYSVHDRLRFKIIEMFQGYPLVILPQTLTDQNASSSHFQRCIQVYCCNKNLTIVLRDELSYSLAKKHFNGSTRLIMGPDMAFQIGPMKRMMSPVFDILWIRRTDVETPGNYAIPEVPSNIRIHITDWLHFRTPKAKTGIETAFYSTTMGLFFLQRARVVITDRLHGHILTTLMDIPHVILDNKAKKLSSFHDTWTRSLEHTKITDNAEEALKIALEMLDTYKDKLPPRVPWLNVSETFSTIILNKPDYGFP